MKERAKGCDMSGETPSLRNKTHPQGTLVHVLGTRQANLFLSAVSSWKVNHTNFDKNFSL